MPNHMQVYWSKAAKQDRYDIALYISKKNVDAACNLLDKLDNAARKLRDFPYIAPEERVKGTREFVVHSHYILVYEVHDNIVIILAVLHTSKQYPHLVQ